MTLWNLIRDFFVENIFGGILSNGHEIENFVGLGYHTESLDGKELYTNTMMLKLGDYSEFYGDLKLNSISLGDWLSTTFTIITLILLVIFLIIFVKWIFKVFAGLFRY